MSLNPNDIKTFYIRALDMYPDEGRVDFHFSFDDQYYFCETINFGKAFDDLSDECSAGLERALEFLHVALGVSYYKAFVPDNIGISDHSFSAEALDFFKKFYRKGLGEFAYRNEVDLSDKLNFTADKCERSPSAIEFGDDVACLFGGGKDSLVSIEVLRDAGRPLSLFCVNPKAAHQLGIERTGLPLLRVERKIDPALFELNEQGALNGHVPITGILCFISAAAAFIYDYRTITLSNERSANEGNVQGEDINHQYSKSLEFETDFQDLVKEEIAANLDCFSLLRPLSELQIVDMFARTDKYDQVFTSCNGNFKLRVESADRLWCGECAKCAFAFLILATAMPKARVLSIFGENLLEKDSLLDTYRSLIGEGGAKPWDCVGEFDESRAALWKLSTDEDWTDTYVVKALAKAEDEKLWSAFFVPSNDHIIPSEFYSSLKDALK